MTDTAFRRMFLCMDLGREINHDVPSQAYLPSGGKKHTSYPSFNLSDEIAKKFGAEYDCEVGDELTANVKLRVSGIREDEYGHSITFDVVSLDDVTETGGADKEAEPGESDDEEEKTLGYKRPAGNHETPSLSSLTD